MGNSTSKFQQNPHPSNSQRAPRPHVIKQSSATPPNPPDKGPFTTMQKPPLQHLPILRKGSATHGHTRFSQNLQLLQKNGSAWRQTIPHLGDRATQPKSIRQHVVRVHA